MAVVPEPMQLSFQSLVGTLKTGADLESKRINYKFQSLVGTLKTGHALGVALGNISFNPS